MSDSEVGTLELWRDLAKARVLECDALRAELERCRRQVVDLEEAIRSLLEGEQ